MIHFVLAAAMVTGVPLLQSNLQQGAPLRRFTASAISGQVVRSATMRGRANVLFFFCACVECRRVADGWSGLQQKKALEHASLKVNGKSPATWVVYAGSTDETRSYLHATGVRVVQGLADPEFSLAKTFRAMPCPTILVTDANGVVRYASKERAGELQADSGLLLKQTLEALRSIKSKPQTGTSDRKSLPATSPRLTAQLVKGQNLSTDGSLVEQPLIAADLELVVREFKWVNKSAKAMEVEQLLTSCGCERATLLHRGKAVKAARIEPNEQVTIRLEFTMSRLDYTKIVTAWLFSTAVEPVATVRVEARREE